MKSDVLYPCIIAATTIQNYSQFFFTVQNKGDYTLSIIFDYKHNHALCGSCTMEKAIQQKVRKDLDTRQHHTILKLKGSLISRGYTKIIYILDQDEDFYITTFQTAVEKRNEVNQFISAHQAGKPCGGN